MQKPLSGMLDRKQVYELVDRLVDNLIHIKDETGEFLLHLDDGRIIDTKGWAGWEWTHGIGLYGMWQYHDMTGDENTLKIIINWFNDRLFVEGSTTKNINTMAVFLSLAHVYERYGDHRYKPYLDAWAEWAMYDLGRTQNHGLMEHHTYLSLHKNQVWDDTLMMTVMPLTKIGLLLNRPHYVQEAKKQMLLHIKYLTDTRTGLFFHGYTFDDNSNFARALWARGNSWITIVIPEFLSLVHLPDGDPVKETLLESFRSQVAALAQLQDQESGMWHTLLDDPTSYVESSATAGFAFGILKGIRMRYIPAETYLPVATRAIEAVVRNIAPSGELLNTSFGTGMGRDLQFYKDIPLTSMPYGQAMAMMALTEYLHTFM